MRPQTVNAGERLTARNLNDAFDTIASNRLSGANISSGGTTFPTRRRRRSRGGEAEAYPFQIDADPAGTGEQGYRQLIMRSGLLNNNPTEDAHFTAPENDTSYLWLDATFSGFTVNTITVHCAADPTSDGWAAFPDIGSSDHTGNLHLHRWVLIATITTGDDDAPTLDIEQHAKSAVFVPMPETEVTALSTTQAVDVNVFVSGLSIMQGKKTFTFVNGRLTAISSESDSTIVTGATCT